jgi:hypothetical protein
VNQFPSSTDAKYARLIAAAPDLLEACKAIEKLEFSLKNWDTIFAQVQAAIARAEGRD